MSHISRQCRVFFIKIFLITVLAIIGLNILLNITPSSTFFITKGSYFDANTPHPGTLKRPRIAAILTATPNIRYLFALPFAAAAWQKLGVEPIVIVVGNLEKLKNHYQLKVTTELLAELGAQIHFIQNETTTAPTLSQTSRLFAAAMPFSKEFNKNDIFITTDADIVPFHLKNHIPNVLAAQRVYLYNADCTNTTIVPPARGNYNVRMYPMSTIAATLSTWREIMGFSSTDFNGKYIESYLKAEFGKTFFHSNDGDKKNLIDKGLMWYADQSLISYKIDAWFKSNPDNRAASTLTRGGCHPRIDRSAWPEPKDMLNQKINLFGDAHVLEEGYAHGQWEKFQPLIQLVFKGSKYALLRKRFDQFRIDYVAH